MSITPGDPTLWVGVIFVRKGNFVLITAGGRLLVGHAFVGSFTLFGQCNTCNSLQGCPIALLDVQ